jgi:hypothetical protein
VVEDEIHISPRFSSARLDDVTFRRAASFTGASFTGETAFRKIRFEGGPTSTGPGLTDQLRSRV